MKRLIGLKHIIVEMIRTLIFSVKVYFRRQHIDESGFGAYELAELYFSTQQNLEEMRDWIKKEKDPYKLYVLKYQYDYVLRLSNHKSIIRSVEMLDKGFEMRAVIEEELLDARI
jgi:hypothetical protein